MPVMGTNCPNVLFGSCCVNVAAEVCRRCSAQDCLGLGRVGGGSSRGTCARWTSPAGRAARTPVKTGERPS